jgi:hypothetical protein
MVFRRERRLCKNRHTRMSRGDQLARQWCLLQLIDGPEGVTVEDAARPELRRRPEHLALSGLSAECGLPFYTGGPRDGREWPPAKINFAIRRIFGQIAHDDSIDNDGYPDLNADLSSAKASSSISNWGGECLGHDSLWQHSAVDGCRSRLPQTECGRVA